MQDFTHGCFPLMFTLGLLSELLKALLTAGKENKVYYNGKSDHNQYS